MIVIGLMSGTSADGTDIAIAQLEGAPPQLKWDLLHHQTVAHPAKLRSAIQAAMSPSTSDVAQICHLNVAIGEQFARVVALGLKNAGLSAAQVDLIGSHGQTVWHAPDEFATLQIGEAAVIAERTGIPVVNNFRARDLAAGGQGAPLVAYVDQLMLTHPSTVRVAQNIGGIANLTFLPPLNRPDLTPLAFDTGPGNILIDLITQLATDGDQQFDVDGALAAQGQANEPLLAWLLANPYYQQTPPKSTGRELYTVALAQKVWDRGASLGLTAADIVATVTALTIRTIVGAYGAFLPDRPDEIIVSGGGSHNLYLMSHLAQAIRPAKLITANELGVNSDAKEALAFAILAYESWHRRTGTVPSATGARNASILGQITYV